MVALGHREVVVAHPDETLRAVVDRMTECSAERMPVVGRADPALVGC